jgi:hypothetical protein
LQFGDQAFGGISLQPGLITNNVIFANTGRGATNNTSTTTSIENYVAHGLADYSWIPNGFM